VGEYPFPDRTGQTVSVARITRWLVSCSLLFPIDRQDVDAGPPVMPTERHAFSALKLTAVLPRLASVPGISR
ncbi:hypothetical protein KGY14_15920, partial [Ameyamaea chiangmaiensis]|uniref:hypothetical protein n=1 Tax=Ameyamaea chiangmaiensis TaxID=442969 RepID=UPI001BAF3939